METVTRSKNDWTTAAALRVLLKSNLKLNARQVSVSTGHSNRYLTITIRDANVDIAAVEKFAASFDTMTIDITDYAEGQSVNVVLSDEVKNALAAPFIEEVNKAVVGLPAGKGRTLSNGLVLWRDLAGRGFHIETADGVKRTPYVWEYDVLAGTGWALMALARNVGILAKSA